VPGFAVAVLLLTVLIWVGGMVSAVRLEAKPPAIGWVLAGYAILALAAAEPSYFIYLIFVHDPDLAGTPFAFWLWALAFLAALLGTAYAIAVQKWGRREYGDAVMFGFVAVFLLYTLAAALQVLAMR